MKTLAMAGQLSLLAFIGEGFSIDSFAMPYLWIMAGVIAALGFLYRDQINEIKSPSASGFSDERLEEGES